MNTNGRKIAQNIAQSPSPSSESSPSVLQSFTAIIAPASSPLPQTIKITVHMRRCVVGDQVEEPSEAVPRDAQELQEKSDETHVQSFSFAYDDPYGEEEPAGPR